MTQLGPAGVVAAPPAPAHVVLVLALVPLASSDTRQSRVRLPSGWRGAGGAASRCQLPRGCRGCLLGAVIRIQRGCSAHGVCSWPRAWGEQDSGPAVLPSNSTGEIF